MNRASNLMVEFKHFFSVNDFRNRIKVSHLHVLFLPIRNDMKDIQTRNIWEEEEYRSKKWRRKETPWSVTENLYTLDANYPESRSLGSVSSLENIFLKLGCTSSNLIVSVNKTSISKYSHAVSLNSKWQKTTSNTLFNIQILIGISS